MKHLSADIIVVGGGAAGMMAAIVAAREGKKVIILEHADQFGKKILATGNGRCNFTNTVQGISFYRSEEPMFVEPALHTFDAEAAIRFFHELGILSVAREGYCYPRNMQASAIRNVLMRELELLGVQRLTDIGIRRIAKNKQSFEVETKTGNLVSKKVILATGGKADPKSGSDGSGYIYAKQLGHSITDTAPALVPLVSDAGWLKEVKGVRQNACVSLFINQNFTASDTGEVQFADYGISGIPVFQISRFASLALNKGYAVEVKIDFIPELDGVKLREWLKTTFSFSKNNISLKQVLNGVVNQKLAEMLSQKIPFADHIVSSLSKKQLDKMLEKAAVLLKETVITVTGTKSFAQAQVTAGGVSTKEVCSHTMESRLVEGLYFAGEILDVDGMCGGYNLQWAWMSGYVAGKHAAQYIKR